MAIRKKLNHDTRTREKIKTSQIINRLTKHIHGEVEMSATQVTSALGLLRKTLPDLQSVELNAQVTHTDARELSDAELANIASTSSAGTSKQKGSAKVSNSVH